MRRRALAFDSAPSLDLLGEVRTVSRPLQSEGDLDPLLARIRSARVVLLGEASHGTHEYYTWRTTISQRLIQEAGFSFIAVEGDWPDCYRLNDFVKGHPGTAENADETLQTFRRWPTWMWANAEISELATWLRKWNRQREEWQRVGFYGLDVYSLWDSLYEILRYLQQHDPSHLSDARQALRCFEPFGEDAQKYARFTRLVPESCEEEVVSLLEQLRTQAEPVDSSHRDGRFAAEQNALVVKNAEAYYRAMVRSDRSSWNIRDRHMAETLDRLLQLHGRDAKAIVWEHNTHIGDARFTDMSDAGMVNIGQLARETYGSEQVALVGFGSYRGEVIAGAYWDAPWEVMHVPAARDGSWEAVLHEALPTDQLLIFESASEELAAWRGQRAIGVVYDPDNERYGNYVPTVLPRRYDTFLFIDQTTAVRPLIHPSEAEWEEVPETYPTGV